MANFDGAVVSMVGGADKLVCLGRHSVGGWKPFGGVDERNLRRGTARHGKVRRDCRRSERAKGPE